MTIEEKIENGEISRKAAKEVHSYIEKYNCSVDDAIDKLGLKQCIPHLSDVEKVFNNIDSDEIVKYKETHNNKELFGYLIGQIMKLSRGTFNPQLVNQFLKDKGFSNEN